MRLTIESKHLNGIVVLAPEVFEDARGFFMEALVMSKQARRRLEVNLQVKPG